MTGLRGHSLRSCSPWLLSCPALCPSALLSHLCRPDAQCLLPSSAQSPAAPVDPLQQAYAGMQHYTGEPGPEWDGLDGRAWVQGLTALSLSLFLCSVSSAAYPAAYSLVAPAFPQPPALVAQQPPPPPQQQQQQREGGHGGRGRGQEPAWRGRGALCLSGWEPPSPAPSIE